MDPIIGGALITGGANLLGDILGGIGSIQSAREQRKAAEAQQRAAKEAAEYGRKQLSDIEQWLLGQEPTKLTTDEQKRLYSQLFDTQLGYIDDFASSKPERYTYDKSVDDYLSPYVDEIISRAGTDVLHKYGMTGMGDSGFEQMAAFRKEAETLNDLEKEAYQRYASERDFDYKTWNDYITQQNNKLSSLMNATGNLTSNLGQAISNDLTRESDYLSDLLATKVNKAQIGMQSLMTGA